MRKKIKRGIAALLLVMLCVNVLTPLTAEAAESRVNTILNNMTLKEKIIQMMMVDFRKWDTDLTDSQSAQDFEEMNEQVQEIVETYNFGAIIYFANNIKGTEQSYNLSIAMQEAAMKNGGIPMLIGTDQEGGNVYRLGSGTALPGNMALGAAGSESYSELAGSIVGSELSAVGINVNLAPVVDVNNNASNPVIGLRSYGEDAEKVGNLASAFIDGMNESNVIGCAKHFPGHGDTDTDSHYGLPCVDKSKDVLMENELKPYQVLIENGIDMIMTAHILYPQLDSSTIYSEKTGEYESVPATMSKAIITDLLKEEMGFEGIVTTDSMRMDAIASSWDSVQAVVNAINAGVDMICMPCVLYDLEDMKDLDKIIDGVEAAVGEGTIPEERIDDAVTRILTVKENRGILDYDAADYTLENAKAVVGSDENREAERQIAAAAVTVVKNENDVLPLEITEESKVLMLCPYDNERAQLVMGWNRAKSAGLIPDGAQMDYYRYSSATITDTLKEKLDWADTIIVISEVSTAARMAYADWRSSGPNNFVNYASENDKISVVMSADKPYDVQLYPNADAIMAVYGCKGSTADPTEAANGQIVGTEDAYGPNIIAGIEVALGVFGATGKLPVTIPEFDSSTSAYKETVVYPMGYGITYDSLIKKEPIKLHALELSQEVYTYDGSEHEPEVIVTDENGETLILNEDYTIAYSNNVNAGTATVTVNGIGDHEGTISKDYVIEKADQTFTAKLAKSILKIGEKTSVKTEVLSGTGEISYTVSNEKIISVDEAGRVTAKTSGNAVISVHIGETANYNAKTIELQIKVRLDAPKMTFENIVSNGRIKILWEEMEGAVNYELYRSNSKYGTYTKIATTDKLSYIDTSAAAGGKYYYKLRAISNGKFVSSAYSDALYWTCNFAKPEITLSNVSSTGKIKVSWQEIEGAENYEIYRAGSKYDSYKKIATTKDISYIDTAAKAGRKYYYKVRAVDAKNTVASAFSTAKYRTCDLPRPEVKASTTQKGIKLTWSAVSGAEKYEIYRATSSGGTYKKIYTTEKVSFINTSVVSGKTYYYKVKAIYQNTAANSAYSKVVYKKK